MKIDDHPKLIYESLWLFVNLTVYEGIYTDRFKFRIKNLNVIPFLVDKCKMMLANFSLTNLKIYKIVLQAIWHLNTDIDLRMIWVESEIISLIIESYSLFRPKDAKLSLNSKEDIVKWLICIIADLMKPINNFSNDINSQFNDFIPFLVFCLEDNELLVNIKLEIYRWFDHLWNIDDIFLDSIINLYPKFIDTISASIQDEVHEISYYSLRLIWNVFGHSNNSYGDQLIKENVVKFIIPFLNSSKESDLEEVWLWISNIVCSPLGLKEITKTPDVLLKILGIISTCSGTKTIFQAVMVIGNIIAKGNIDTIEILIKNSLVPYFINILKSSKEPKTKLYILKILNNLFNIKKKVEMWDNEYAYEFHINSGVDVLEAMALNEKNENIRKLWEKILDYFFRESSL